MGNESTPRRTPSRAAQAVMGSAVVTMALLVAPSPASAAPDVPSGDAPVIVNYHSDRPLQNATVRTLTGIRAAAGGCVFSFPKLELAADQTALEARQIQTNFTDCTTKVETGTPLTAADDVAGGASESQSAVTRGRPQSDGPAGINATSSSGYYRVWWEDVIHLRVNEVKTNVSWTWDGSCVTASNGSANYWWLTTTGWYKDSSSVFIARSCDNARVYTDAVYKNSSFCAGTVTTSYNNVTAQGKYSGTLVGWVDGTSTSYPALCPSLHYHTEIRRVTG